MIPLWAIGFAGRAWSVARQVPWYFWLSVAVALAFVLLGSYEHHAGVVEGKRDVIEDLTKKDQKLESDADKASLSVDECYTAGRNWNKKTGRCDPKEEVK